MPPQHQEPQPADKVLQDAATFRAVLDGASEAIFVTDSVKGKILDVNQTACKRLGYSRDELLAMTVQSIQVRYPIHDEKAWAQMASKIRDGEDPLTVRGAHQKKDGSTFPVEVTIDNTYVGKQEYFIVVARDISERVAEEESAARFRAVVDNASEALFVIDPDTKKFVDTNETACKRLGYSKEELLTLGPAGIEVKFPLHTDEEWTKHIQSVKASGKPFIAGGNHRRKDGSTFPVEVSVSVEHFGERDYMLAVARDITERTHSEEALRESEARWRALTESSPDHVMLVDLDTNLIFINQTVPDLSVEGVIGTNMYDYIPEDQQGIVASCLKRVRQTGEPDTYETRYEDAEGNTRFFEASVGAVTESDKVIAFAINARDVTERLQAERTLRETEKMRSVGQLATGVAHNINNALTAILGYVQVLQRDVGDSEKAQQQLKIIESTSRDAAKIVRRIQSFSRDSTGLELGKIDVNEVAQDALDMSSPTWEKRPQGKKINAKLDLSSEALKVSGNPSELREVLLNITLNAVEAMPDGGDILISTNKGSHNRALIEISDTGAGISEETQKRIFEPFFTTKGELGTGLGLSVSYGIVRRHNGEITVASTPTSGTIFSIVLPLADPEAPDLPSRIT